ncbi:hypothetical protein CANCADRAFT_2959 [Tortispora caseinolytica NRRL Y-17796]|uniref:Core domain-containing protein n=1 Tax=Tortispora caseinolytica NRRL Y-17796 TaxID=767744 RepID=A0A1E4THM3_9ASCO|nr:hypothetical protein CANCADRAFT_2959 [Tortispora caseinolytica NRRL Y-17796]
MECQASRWIQYERRRYMAFESHSFARQKVINPRKSGDGKPLVLNITNEAAKKLHSIMKDENKPDAVLRIIVESGGCHGYQYVFRLESSKDIDADEDTIFDRDGARIVIDEGSLTLLQDSSVDYTTELIGSQFTIHNPYATSSCGCGSSFDLDIERLSKS